MDEATKLAIVLGSNARRNEDEQGLYMILVSYLELHYRLALLTLERQAKNEGFTDEELRGIASTAT